jgi:hypothetical protein
MKRVLTYPINDQSGAVLVAVVLILLAVSALGIMAIQTGSTELDVATNDKFHKIAFFAADGANEMTTEMIGQNVWERGFATSTYGKTNVVSQDFFRNVEDAEPEKNIPSEDNHDIEVPDLANNRVYLRVYGNTQLSTGSALQLAAGYDGIGKGLAGGGARIIYEIRSLANGPANSIARIWLRWLQLI